MPTKTTIKKRTATRKPMTRATTKKTAAPKESNPLPRAKDYPRVARPTGTYKEFIEAGRAFVSNLPDQK